MTIDRLISRLEAFTRAANRLPPEDAERLVELATVATMRAVALDLLQAQLVESGGHEGRVLELPDDAPERLAA